jgi:hypothetical protein
VQGLPERHMTLKSMGNLMSVRLDLLEKQGKKFIKDWKGGSSIYGEPLYVDISLIKGDNYLSYCWNYFLK